MTTQGSRPIWQMTQAVTPTPDVPNQFQSGAVTNYPPGGSIRLGAVAVKTQVAYPNFRGLATLLTLNFADNLGWRVPYNQVPPDQAVRQKYFEPNLGYAETVFDTTVGTVQDVLVASYGSEAVIGEEQDA